MRTRTKTEVFTPTQLHLLRMFSYDDSEERLLEVQKVLSDHFQRKADEELDRLWDEGVLNQEKLDWLRTQDLHQLKKKV